MAKETRYVLPESVFTKVVRVLEQLPYNQVAQLMGEIQQNMETIAAPKQDEEKPKKKSPPETETSD